MKNILRWLFENVIIIRYKPLPEVEKMESKNDFNYVFEACAGKIHPAAIADLLSVPEFVSELMNFGEQIDSDVIFKIASKVYDEAKATRYDKEFKHSYIEKYGEDGWDNYVKRYGLLVNGYRKAKRSVQI